MTNKKEIEVKKQIDSPLTENEQMLSGSHLKNPNTKQTLLFHNILCQVLQMKKQTSHKQAKSMSQQLSLSGRILKNIGCFIRFASLV